MILVLVDVDNLIGKLHERPLAGSLDPTSLRPRLPFRSERSCPVLVSMAMNLASAEAFSGWDAIRSLATLLARQVAPRSSEVRCELALCLTVPEAADQALLRLFGHSPERDPEGDFEEIWLFTRDFGLSNLLTATLKPLCPGRSGDGFRYWSLPGSVARDVPRALPASTSGSVNLPPVTATLDTAARCAWAASRRVQCPSEWPELLDTIARNPWVLSQVGVTWPAGRSEGSVRGVARLRAQLEKREAFLDCSPEDGVEYGSGRVQEAWDFHPKNATAQEASVGPGAVRVSWVEQGGERGLTLRSQLPAWLVRQHGAQIRATTGEPRLDEEAVLGQFHGLAAGPMVKVRFSVQGSALQAKITSGGPCWWWRPTSRPGLVNAPKGRYEAPGAEIFCPRPLEDIEAAQGVAPGLQLYLRSPIAPGTTLVLPEQAGRGQIKLAWLASDPARRCAILAPRKLSAGPLACSPIQSIQPTRLFTLLERHGVSGLEAAGIVPLLQELPLVFPEATK